MSAVLRHQPFQLRLMSFSDLEQVHLIECASYNFPWSSDLFVSCLQANYQCWVLTNGEQIAAYGIFSITYEEAHLLNLCVHPQYRRCGLARSMIRAFVRMLRNHAVKLLYLEVRPSNIGALRLYRSEGFQRLGVHRNYYRAVRGREDAIILARRCTVPAKPPIMCAQSRNTRNPDGH